MAKLGDIFVKQIVGEWGNECNNERNGVFVLRTTNFTNSGVINYDKVVKRDIPDTKVEEKKLKYGDIILEKSGGTDKTPVGRVVFCDNKIESDVYLCNNFTQAMRVDNSIAIPKYVFYLMYYFHQIGITDLLQSKTTGIRNLRLRDYLNTDIKLPNLAEQEHCVIYLDKLTVLISLHQKQLEKLDELVKSRFIEMGGRIQDNKKGYSIVTIGDVCSLIKDGTHQTPEYTEDVKNGYKFLSSKDVMSQKIDWSNIKYISASLHERLYSSLKPQRNDILMSKNGVNYGVAAINDSDEIFDIYVSLALLRPSKSIHPVYLRCVINSADTKNQFDSSIKGIGVPNLHLGEIKNTKILLPPIDLQNQFAEFVKQTDKSKLAVQKSLEQLETLKKSLMQKYFG